MIAAIARYLGKSRPGVEDGPYEGLRSSADHAEVEKAIVLLRLARAFNLGRSRAVEKVRIAVRDAEVKFTLIPRRRMGVDLEQWAVEKERDYFREVFGRELSTSSVVEGREPPSASGTTVKFRRSCAFPPSQRHPFSVPPKLRIQSR